MNLTLRSLAVAMTLLAAVPPATATPIFADEFEGLVCDSALERVQPPGFTANLVQWDKMFYGATFPAGPSHLSPVGSFTLKSLDVPNRGPALNARYYAVPFVPAANKSYKVSWLAVQSIPAVNYWNPRVADSVFVSVSRCQGDLRGQSIFSADPEISKCRAQLANGNLIFGTLANNQCKLIAGEQYYLNIAFVDTAGVAPLSTTQTTCDSGNRCEANFKIN